MLLASKQLSGTCVRTQSEPPQLHSAARLRVLIGRLSRRLRQTQAGAALTPTELSVLATVVRRGPVRLAQLAQLEEVNPTMLSRIVAKLGRDGLVTRRADPLDGRAALLLPTERGRRLRRGIQAERNALLGQRLQALPQSQRQLLMDAIPALEALAESLLPPDR